MYTRSKSACRSSRPLFPALPCGLDPPIGPLAVTAHSQSVGGCGPHVDNDPIRKPGFTGRNGILFAEARLHRYPLATLGAPARQHCGSALGLHARTESVLLRALTPVWLESALGHEKSLLLIRSMAFGQTVSINDLPQTRQSHGPHPPSVARDVAGHRTGARRDLRGVSIPNRTTISCPAIRFSRKNSSRAGRNLFTSTRANSFRLLLARDCAAARARARLQKFFARPDSALGRISAKPEVAPIACFGTPPQRCNVLHHSRCSYIVAT